MLYSLVKWRPQEASGEGFSVVIGCMKALSPVAVINLRLCASQKSDHLREIIAVFDCLAEDVPNHLRTLAEEASIAFPIRILGYSKNQYRVARFINWGWVYSWLSWCIGIREARTQAVIFHDLDAFPLDSGLFDQIYAHWSHEKPQFCGISYYIGNGINRDMGLMTTFELIVDADYIRKTFRPFDLFNKLKIINGKLIDFDTMLYAECLSPQRELHPVEESQLVHPSMMICGYVDFIAGRKDFNGEEHTLPMLAYYLFLAGLPDAMMALVKSLKEKNAETFSFIGRPCYINGIQPKLWAWYIKQICKLEQFFFHRIRPEIQEYLEEFAKRAKMTLSEAA